MIDVKYCQLMAEYNKWMNGKIFRVGASISEKELRKDCGAYLKSIYMTLNHIAYADLAFISRFTDYPPDVSPLGEDLFGGFTQLRTDCELMDQRLLIWSTTLTPDLLALPLTYVSKAD